MSVERLRIAVQSKGRLADASLSLFEKTGLRFRRDKDELLFRVEDQPIDVLRVRDDDIVQFVLSGTCELGFVGANVYEEALLDHDRPDTEIVARLGFGRCALKIAAPRAFDYAGPKSLAGLRVATSHPNLLKRFLSDNDVEARVVELAGSVEVAPRLGIADAVCDLVSTGATLEANGLRAVDTVLESEAVLVGSTRALSGEMGEAREKFLRRLDGVLATQGTKYIMMNAPETAIGEITEILPGADAPTVVPLASRQGSVAVHAVCQESVFWETLERLKAAGASAILVLPIEKMMM